MNSDSKKPEQLDETFTDETNTGETTENTEASLESALEAWTPDADASDEETSEEEAIEAAGSPVLTSRGSSWTNPELKNDGSADLTLIHDPYSIATSDVQEAQDISDEELDLDEPSPEEIDEDFEGEEENEEAAEGLESAADDVIEGLDLESLASGDDVDAFSVSDLNLEETLANVSRAISEEEEKAAAEHAIRVAELNALEAERLAAEIAEDEALAQAAALEAAEDEKLDDELEAALPNIPERDPETGAWEVAEVESCIEALLFMSDKPVSQAKLQDWLGPEFPAEIFAQALESLQRRYTATAHGIELLQIGGGWQFRTKPIRAPLARKLAKVQTQRLSGGAMETLSIIAYKQPCLKDDVDTIRGVDSSHFVRGLLDKKLIQITGRSDLPGRPMLYTTTPEFLELFGLADLSALPSLREIEGMVPGSQSQNPGEEDPRVREMRKLVAQMKSDTSGRLKYDPREDEKILKEIREKVQQIPASTPWLEEQKAQEKARQQEALLAAQGLAPAADPLLNAEGQAELQLSAAEAAMAAMVADTAAAGTDAELSEAHAD